MIVLRREDDTSQVALDDGATFAVRLPENATTGYQWQVTARPAGVELLADDLIPAADLRPGAGGEHEFRFRAGPAPAGSLVLELRRSWESDREPADTFSVQLRPAARRASG
jgi:inhibitor of cysteine peptidase